MKWSEVVFLASVTKSRFLGSFEVKSSLLDNNSYPILFIANKSWPSPFLSCVERKILPFTKNLFPACQHIFVIFPFDYDISLICRWAEVGHFTSCCMKSYDKSDGTPGLFDDHISDSSFLNANDIPSSFVVVVIICVCCNRWTADIEVHPEAGNILRFF